MADPLSISASVAGLLNLVIQVADGTYQYVSSARSASSTISSLLRELQALEWNGKDSLSIGSKMGTEDIVRLLLSAGADMSHGSGETLLDCAARNRHGAIIDLLLHHQSHILLGECPSEKDERAQQLLGASIKGDEKLVKRLLELGVDFDARDIDGGTSLQWAAWYGHSGIVAALLDHGADVNAADHTFGRQALHEAIEHRHLKIRKILLARGGEVDAMDKWAGTPLHRGATQGGWRVVEVLLQHGADVNAKTTEGKGPLDLACQTGQLATIPLLLQHGADIKHEIWNIEDIEFWATIPNPIIVKVREILSKRSPGLSQLEAVQR